jgi:hypothetical protein
MNKKLHLNIFVAFIMLLMFTSNGALAQNIAINASGLAANASAMLDISSGTSGNRGLLIPRVTSAQKTAMNPLPAAAQGLVVYQTNGVEGFYYNTSTTTVPAWSYLSSSTGWTILGNAGTSVATNFLGTTDAIDFAVRANNTERMRILSAGNILFGRTTTLYTTDLFEAQGSATFPDAINAYTGIANATALYGEATAAGSVGSFGINTNATGFGHYGLNTNATGTGIIGIGNNAAGSYLLAGSGGAFTGLTTGVFAYNTSLGVSQAIYSNNGGVIVRMNYWSGVTQFKINGTGTMPAACTVPDLNGNQVEMYSSESPDFVFNDFGGGDLINGKAHIDLDPIYAKSVIIDDKHPLRVFIQLEGDCKGVYVTNKTATGFDVQELGAGTSNVAFQWQVISNVKDVVRPDGTINHLQDIRYAPANLPSEEVLTPSKTIKKK